MTTAKMRKHCRKCHRDEGEHWGEPCLKVTIRKRQKAQEDLEFDK